ncbi:MAG: hypothetical protein H7Y88_06925 [Phycisphaerales bacterium]|nr:hypothetical protein [Phycisphaerales bacterium]
MVALAGTARADFTFYWDAEFSLRAVTNAGVQEPSVPVYLNGARIDDGGTPGSELYDIVEMFDRVPGTSSYPLTVADIVANGYVRPVVQRTNGTTGSFGTSVVTHAAFRAAGQPLDLVPDMTRADVAAPLAAGPERHAVQGTGAFGARASIVSTRRYPDPEVGRTEFEIQYTWTALQNIALPPAPGGRGFDCFRLVMLSSMLADLNAGVYDANYLAVTSAQGTRRTIRLRDDLPTGHVFSVPRATGLGGGFELLKDNGATWNPGSPSIRVEIVEVSGPVGIAGSLGVQGFLLASENPNDDSLSVWLEWTGAPAVVNAGTVITARLRILAKMPTDPGDLNRDGAFTCDDYSLATALLGRVEADADFDAYADLDADGEIDGADLTLLAELAGLSGADFDGNGAIGSADITAFLVAWFADLAGGTLAADFNQSGVTSSVDITAFLAAWFEGLETGC